MSDYCSVNKSTLKYSNVFGVMKKRVANQKTKIKAYKTTLCILLFNADWQVASVNCPSALPYLSPVFAGLLKRGTSSLRGTSQTSSTVSIWKSKKLSQRPISVWDDTTDTNKVPFCLIVHQKDLLASHKYVCVWEFCVFLLQVSIISFSNTPFFHNLYFGTWFTYEPSQ